MKQNKKTSKEKESDKGAKKESKGKFIRYIDAAFGAFWKLVRHPVIFLPDFIMVLIGFAFGKLFYLFNFKKAISSASVSGTFNAEVFQQIFMADWIKAAISGAAIVFIMFFAGAGADVIKFSMIVNLLKKNSASLRLAWKEKKKFYFKIVLFKIFAYGIEIFGWAIGASMGIAAYKSPDNASSTILGIAALVWVIAFSIVLKLGLLFGYPVMLTKRKISAYEAVKKSFVLFFNNKKMVFVLWLICIAIPVFVLLCGLLAGGVVGSAFEIAGLGAAGLIAGRIIGYCTSIISRTWVSLFIFESYFKKRFKRFK